MVLYSQNLLFLYLPAKLAQMTFAIASITQDGEDGKRSYDNRIFFVLVAVYTYTCGAYGGGYGEPSLIGVVTRGRLGRRKVCFVVGGLMYRCT